jgi:hypothetical protein
MVTTGHPLELHKCHIKKESLLLLLVSFTAIMKFNESQIRTHTMVQRAQEIIDEFEAHIGFSSLDLMKQSTSRKRKKVVRFATESLPSTDNNTKRYQIADFQMEQRNVLWWTAKECAISRRRAMEVASYTRGHGQLFIKQTLDHTYRIVNTIASTHDDKDFQRILHDPSNHTAAITEWNRRSNGRRGLERYITNSTIRAECIAVHRESVLSACAFSSSTNIAEISMKLSRASRLFARMLGEGDSSIVHELEVGDSLPDK